MNLLKKFVSSAISLAIAISLVLALTIGFSGTAMALGGAQKAQLQPIEECVPVRGAFKVGPIRGQIRIPVPINSVVVKLDPPFLRGTIDNISILTGDPLRPTFQCRPIPVRDGDNLLATCGRGPIFLPPGPFIYAATGIFDPPISGKFCVQLD